MYNMYLNLPANMESKLTPPTTVEYAGVIFCVFLQKARQDTQSILLGLANSDIYNTLYLLNLVLFGDAEYTHPKIY